MALLDLQGMEWKEESGGRGGHPESSLSVTDCVASAFSTILCL
jgi:hypothetical protein